MKLEKEKIGVISSGITSMDRSLHKGGFQEGTMVLIKGDAGSRKDLFGYHFVLHGLKNGEEVVFYDVEASSDEILYLIKTTDELKHLDNLDFVDACPEYSKFYINAVPAKIIEHVKNLNGPRRVLINPLTFFVEKFGIEDTGDFLIRIRDLAMRKKLVVVLLMADILSELEMQSIIDKCDGIIELETKSVIEDIFHVIKIRKFGVGQKHSPLSYLVRDKEIKITAYKNII